MSELLNLIGLTMGIVLYTVLLVMVVGADRTGAQRRIDPLLLATSLLGLVWNLCALPAYELPRIGVGGTLPVLTAIGFSALGFLPAVVVHSVLRGEHQRVAGAPTRSLLAAAYTASTLAAVLHLVQAARGEDGPSPFGMQLLTYTYVALVVPLAAVTRNQAGARRTLWAAALAIFAVSALHLSQLHRGDSSWPVELLGHHASLPLAIAILYQDFPFAFADLFLKRALSLLTAVAVAFAGIAIFSAQSRPFAELVWVDPRQVGVLVTFWVATALLFPWIRRAAAWFVDRIVLSRPNYRTLRADVIRRIQTQTDVPALLADICHSLAPALNAADVSWRDWHRSIEESAVPVTASGQRALVIVPTADPPRFAIDVGGLEGGRRLLSDDVATLEAIAIAVARRIDAIRITRERYEREMREQEVAKLATEAELRALRAQINPHFLFNALTTIGYLIQTAPPRALETLMRLTALLRGVLRSEGEFTSLGRELDLIEAYLDIERARFEQRLRVAIDVPLRLRNVRVPPLVVQPLVENAVKHGIAPKGAGGEVTIVATVDDRGTGRQLVIVVRDTGVGASAEELKRGRARGVGLRNVERRLETQYGHSAALTIESVAGRGTTVEMRIPIVRSAASADAADRVAV
jgi:two-component system, LytTR family, sensor kinase